MLLHTEKTSFLNTPQEDAGFESLFYYNLLDKHFVSGDV
jgi:hypothetical protein